MQRPSFIGDDWMTCTTGLAFREQPPADAALDRFLTSANLWDRVVCVFLQAKSGDFRNCHVWLETAAASDDWLLRDCAMQLFALASPRTLLVQLGAFFGHQDRDTRHDAYAASSLSCDLTMAELLGQQHAQTGGSEREWVGRNIRFLVEPLADASQLSDELPEAAFQAALSRCLADLKQALAPDMAVARGAKLDAQRIVDSILDLCREEEPEQFGGEIAYLFSLLEGLTGASYAGCLDDDCAPVIPRIASLMNHLNQTGIARALKSGRRYFFGHEIP